MPVSDKVREAQLRYYKQQVDLVDFETIPRELRDVVDKTSVSEATMGEVVRYAHERLAAAYREVQEAEDDLTQRNIFGKDRGYGRSAEAGIERAAHRNDKDWIRRARTSELAHEARVASWERQCVEASASNLRQVIENHDRVEALKAAGRVSVYTGRTDMSSMESRSPRNGSNRGNNRGGRGGNRGRGGGQGARTDSTWWRDK